MSSPPKEKVETKAGHLPAGQLPLSWKTVVKNYEDVGRTRGNGEIISIPKSPKLTVPIIISGAIARGDKDFPPAAAQVAHQKPYPSVEKLPVSHQINQSIHQPRK